MQFLPATWTHVGQDANGDGVKDVNQIDDAALAAATYLCDAGGDLTVARDWIRAVGAYNHSTAHNDPSQRPPPATPPCVDVAAAHAHPDRAQCLR